MILLNFSASYRLDSLIPNSKNLNNRSNEILTSRIKRHNSKCHSNIGSPLLIKKNNIIRTTNRSIQNSFNKSPVIKNGRSTNRRYSSGLEKKLFNKSSKSCVNLFAYNISRNGIKQNNDNIMNNKVVRINKYKLENQPNTIRSKSICLNKEILNKNYILYKDNKKIFDDKKKSENKLVFNTFKKKNNNKNVLSRRQKKNNNINIVLEENINSSSFANKNINKVPKIKSYLSNSNNQLKKSSSLINIQNNYSIPNKFY